MAMDSDRLGDAILAALVSLNPDINGNEQNRLRPYWRAIAAEIIEEIQDHAVVTTTGVSAGAVSRTGTID